MKKLIVLVLAVLLITACFTSAVSDESGLPRGLAGTWTGVGTPANGGTPIDLSVTIREDGNGEYLFKQGTYSESFPFSVSWTDNTFTVDIPATAGLGTVAGTYALNDDVLTLDITTTFPNGRQYKYTADCRKTSDPGGWTCPECQTVNQDSWNFCVTCGQKKPVSIVCTSCGAEYPEDVSFLFCPECGTKLEKGGAAPDPSPAPTQVPVDDPEVSPDAAEHVHLKYGGVAYLDSSKISSSADIHCIGSYADRSLLPADKPKVIYMAMYADQGWSGSYKLTVQEPNGNRHNWSASEIRSGRTEHNWMNEKQDSSELDSGEYIVYVNGQEIDRFTVEFIGSRDGTNVSARRDDIGLEAAGIYWQAEKDGERNYVPGLNVLYTSVLNPYGYGIKLTLRCITPITRKYQQLRIVNSVTDRELTSFEIRDPEFLQSSGDFYSFSANAKLAELNGTYSVYLDDDFIGEFTIKAE